MNSRAKRYIAITALGLVYGTMFNLPYIKYVFYDAMIDGMGVSNTKLGLLLTVYTIVSTLGLLPGGWIADRFKTKGIIVGSAFLNGIICFFFMFTMRNYEMCIRDSPSTISKEVRLHAHTKERPDSGYTHPCLLYTSHIIDLPFAFYKVRNLLRLN